MAKKQKAQKKLTKRELFAREYLIDRNATQAAIRAGYSEKTAHSQGPRLLEFVEVKELIAKFDSERMERVNIDADYVLKRLHDIDQMDVLDIFNDDLTALKPLSEWPKVWRISVSAIDVAEMLERQDDVREVVGYLKKVRWLDKSRNLEMLGKHVNVNAFRENVQHSMDDDLAQKILEARKRGSQEKS